MSKDVLAQEVIHALAEAVQRGGRSLAAVPGLLRRLIDEGLWQERSVNGELVRFNKSDFRAFVEADYPVGLSTTLETIEALCGHEPKVMDFIAQAKQGKPGRPIGSTNNANKRVDAQGNVTQETVYNVHNKLRPSGNSSERTRNHLRNTAYDIDQSTGEIRGVKDERARKLYEDVLEGRKKPNAAALEAGLRTQRIAINLDNPHSAVRTILKHMDRENLLELYALLKRELDQ